MEQCELWVQEKRLYVISQAPKVLEWAARSNSGDIKLLVAEIKSKLLQEPSKTEGREKYGR